MGSGWARTVFMGMDRRRFFGEGELFLDDFFLMVIGDWNCHYRRYGGRKMWSWSCISKVYSSSPSVFFSSKQNRKTVKMYLLV